MSATCKDCIHYDVCQYHVDEETELTVVECSYFKSKSAYEEAYKKRQTEKAKLMDVYGMIEKVYEHAKQCDYIKNPLAYAIHKVWQIVDRRKEGK